MLIAFNVVGESGADVRHIKKIVQKISHISKGGNKNGSYSFG